MTLLYLSFIMLSILSGIKEAILYGRKAAETFKWNEHILFVLERAFIFSLPFTTYAFIHSWGGILWAIIAGILSYPFWHDGFYYETARQINRPDYNFFSDSKTSTAKIEITWPIRVLMFGLGMAIIIFNFVG